MGTFVIPHSVTASLASNKQLLEAVYRSDYENTERLINDGADVDDINVDEQTWLHIVAMLGNLNLTKFLLEKMPHHIFSQDPQG